MLQADGITYEIETPDGPLKLLDNVSFNVPRGHFMAIVGPSGCGKTTLLKAIAGMIAETDGRFFWNGHDLAEEDFEPSEIGFVPQFSIAYDQLSVDENVESAARLRCRFDSVDDLDDSIDNALEVTGMEGIADRDVKILSGGQKRRLALAMELVSNPRLLICDEVTSGLDPRSEHDIVDLLHEISRSEGRIVISVTHSLSHLDMYDSILVMHQGCVAYHGSPKTMLHYFGVSSLEEIYPKLQDREGPSWCRSWGKHRDSYYSRMEKEREQKILSGELPDPDAVRKAVKAGEAEEEGAEAVRSDSTEAPAVEGQGDAPEDSIPELPGFFTQFFCLLGRRWRIFFRDRSQLILQLVMILLFPVLVAMFTDKGTGQIVGLSATQDVQTLQKDMEAQQLNMKTGSAVSGIIMFEVILLGLMGSNNAAREVAGERAIMEKEKYAGMRPSAYLGSKLAYLSVLVLVQSVWMFAFVDFFWDRGGGLTHLLFLILADAAMTFVCLGISSLARSADQASLLSIYLVGFQLPLSGAVLALPEQVEGFIRPFISAYWAWSGSISALKSDVYNAVKNVLDTDLTPALLCYVVLGVHVACGIAASYAGIRRSRWEL
ncbi:ATP-binding cassette domain-containing protein [uncultured Akkermansia sp.]|jgi:ABC-type multidrug transport system ATPase subunit|uniref:ABC transporter ATP-binding protein/permease n=1 Tax=uncultured Akkermansia sp. TaxID=512294 RepID=UPI0025EF9682|nr:ATP-binding cassette domain-containing protein [uncultured Akkermansia sp.]